MKFVHSVIEESRTSRVIEADTEAEALDKAQSYHIPTQTLETRRTRVEISPLEEVSVSQVVDEAETEGKIQ